VTISPRESASSPNSGVARPPADTARPSVTPLAVPIRLGSRSCPSVTCTANGANSAIPSTIAATNTTAASGANATSSTPGTASR
jgi:hypothetical protein